MKDRAKVNIYSNRSGLSHDTGSGHPESIARLETVRSLFGEKPFSTLPVIEAQAAEEDWIALAHDRDYIRAVAEMVPETGYTLADNDTILSPGSLAAAYDAAGALCQAAEDVMTGKCERAFCAVRPPGHHAMPGKSMGFCIFNNIFIGARYAQEKHGVKRIAIVDFDVHHGNATDYMTRQAEGIFFISSHQFPFWPGTGDPKYDELPPASGGGGGGDSPRGKGYVMNIPLAAGTGSKEFRAVYEAKVFPAINAFKPELLMISAGFDAHRDDPLAELELTEDDYFWVTEKLCALAGKHCGGKVIAALEGGYNLQALKSSLAAHIKALAGL